MRHLRELDAALSAFASIESEGHRPNLFAFAALINAHVSSGDLPGALSVQRRMEAAGIAPNLVVLTTLLKGHCAIGDLAAARSLLSPVLAGGSIWRMRSLSPATSHPKSFM